MTAPGTYAAFARVSDQEGRLLIGLESDTMGVDSRWLGAAVCEAQGARSQGERQSLDAENG